jgi:uncharacterized SAM-binding protein YcdF (DUF218 family)
MEMGIAFILKKGVASLLMPLSLAIILATLSLWFMYKHKYKTAKVFLTLCIMWITTISYAPFSTMLLAPLERQYKKITPIPKDVQYILLLGGAKEERAWEALRLYQAIDNAKIITSGYSFYDTQSDAQKTAKLLEDAGVNTADILMQGHAKDTKEEAKALKMRLGSKAFLLVTSAYHMPRSMMLFKNEGLNPIAAPTYFNNPKESGSTSVWKSKNLRNTERAWHEYLGLLWAKLKGSI